MAEGTDYGEWVVVFRSGTDYEADIVRDRLDDSGVPAVVLTQRDHAFNLNVGDLSRVNVLVPPSREQDALRILESAPFTDAELDEASRVAATNAPDAHDKQRESMLDSGSDQIILAVPDEDDEDVIDLVLQNYQTVTPVRNIQPEAHQIGRARSHEPGRKGKICSAHSSLLNDHQPRCVRKSSRRCRMLHGLIARSLYRSPPMQNAAGPNITPQRTL